MVHAENGDVHNWLTDQLESKKLFAPKYHSHSRPPLLEAEATNRAIALSPLISNTPILLVHVSDPGATRRIRKAQSNGQPIFAETCPQYLFLTRDDLDKPGFEGANSDHCPFNYDDAEKGKKTCIDEQHPVGRFKEIPNGIPGIETRLPLVFSSGKLSLTKFVEVTSTNPAKLYGLYPRKGSLIPGVSDADLVVWYPDAKRPDIRLTNDMLHHATDYTPYEGREIANWPRYTILRGRVVWDRDGAGVLGHKSYGQFVKRGRSSLDRIWETVVEQGDFDVTRL